MTDRSPFHCVAGPLFAMSIPATGGNGNGKRRASCEEGSGRRNSRTSNRSGTGGRGKTGKEKRRTRKAEERGREGEEAEEEESCETVRQSQHLRLSFRLRVWCPPEITFVLVCLDVVTIRWHAGFPAKSGIRWGTGFSNTCRMCAVSGR